MAQMGLGYGSEFQLLRFMGRHRHELESTLLKVIKETMPIDNPTFNWIDFEYADRNKSITGDKELSGLSFLQQRIDPKTYEKICQKIIGIGTFFNNWQSWDAVFVLDGTFYFVEAKAHVGEMRQVKKDNGGASHQQILNFMEEYLKPYGISVNDSWLGKNYQLANRLATIAFLNQMGVKAKAVYIYFIDGFYKQIIVDRKLVFVTKKDTKQKRFEAEIVQEKEHLRLINADLSPILIEPIFIDANRKSL